MPQDWDGRDRVLRKERKRKEQQWTGGEEMVVLMVGEVDVIVSQPGKFSLDATGPPLPAEPTSTRPQTGQRGLNQTHEPQNMTWQVQQEKRGEGQTQCELIELHLVRKKKKKHRVWDPNQRDRRLRFIMTPSTDSHCCYGCSG